jgi:hypothetical protein
MGFSFSFLGLFARGISQSQGRYLHRRTIQTEKHRHPYLESNFNTQLW